MNSNFSFVFLLIISFIFSSTKFTRADEEEIQGRGEMTCKAAMGLLMKELLADISFCSKSMPWKSMKERASKYQCILKCVAIKGKVLTPDGRLDKETLKIFIKKEIPSNLIASASPLLFNCFEKNAQIVDPVEELCKSYKPFMKCFMDALPVICPVEPPAA